MTLRRSAPCLAPILLAILASVATAQSDVLCVCADVTEAHCGGNVEVEVPGSCTVHLLLGRPSGVPVLGWEACVSLEGSAAYVGEWALTAGLNIGTGDEFIVALTLDGMNGLMPNISGTVPLLSMNLLLLGEGPLFFKVGPLPGSVTFDEAPGFISGDHVRRPATVCSGSYDRPVFTVNNGAAAQEGTWGEVKSLYWR